jgi:hypothetical protein
MKRKSSDGESRDLRTLRKLAQKRAAQIGASDRPRIDLEEILGVPIGPPDAKPLTSATPGRVRPDPPRASPERVDSGNPPPAPTREQTAPVVGAKLGPHYGTIGWCQLARLSGAGAWHLRLLAELQLSTVQMLAAPVMSWSRIQRQALTWYLKAMRNAIDARTGTQYR